MHSISLEELEQQVRDCLPHLYDYSFLRDHPLVPLLAPDATGANQVQVFRQVITEAIERLRPDTGVTFHSKQARIYNILTLRYIDQQQAQDVMPQLGLSERQFYRDHPRAIQTLSQILWEQLTGVAVAQPAESTADISVQSEVQRVSSQTEPMRIDIKALLEGAITATQPLADQHDIDLELLLDDEIPILGISGSVLRQAVLLLMSQLIVRFVNGGILSLGAENRGRAAQIRFTLDGDSDPALEQGLAQNQSLQTLVETVKGTLHYQQVSDGTSTVALEIPLNQRTVLLIDDNPGMIDLFQRYLAGQAYHVLIADEGEQAVHMARQSRPDVIILDVMLPGKDGWEVLQNLKTHPTTRHIPVLICSVLDAFDLGLSLGADAYLKKPPNQAEFLKALAHWQGN
jgi:CheY-like chemotaxis protein